MVTRNARAGFTLIEVMIAVVILAVGLSALFTSEAGAIRIAQRARTTTVATLLARCKMGEVEEKVLKEGFPGTDIDGRDECCADAEKDGYRCEWKVERVTLPELGADTGGLTGGLTAGMGGGSTAGLDKLGPSALSDGGTMSSDGGILGSMITSAGSTGDSDPFAQMAMELAFPVMKPVIEENVRRATVTVIWKEGASEQSFDVVQYLVNEVAMLPDESTTEAMQEMGGTAGGTAGGAAGGGAAGGGAAGGGAAGGGAAGGGAGRGAGGAR